MQREAVFRHFMPSILRKIIPGKDQIEEVRIKETSLDTRSWRNIKDFIRNAIASKIH
jgi:hypothetical protein